MASTTTDSERSRAARWLTEIFVIALGILLAFGVDAAWSGLQEAEQQRLTLNALRLEFETNATSLRTVARQHDATARRAGDILALTGPNSSSPDGVAERLIGDIWSPWHVELASGAIQSLLSTNDLARVRDPQLRHALAGWPERAGSLTRLEDVLHSRVSDDLLPAIRQAVPQIDIELVNGFAGLPELRAEFDSLVAPSRFEGDFDSLLTDMQFENIVLQRMTVSMIARDFALELADEADRITDLLTAALR